MTGDPGNAPQPWRRAWWTDARDGFRWGWIYGWVIGIGCGLSIAIIAHTLMLSFCHG